PPGQPAPVLCRAGASDRRAPRPLSSLSAPAGRAGRLLANSLSQPAACAGGRRGGRIVHCPEQRLEPDRQVGGPVPRGRDPGIRTRIPIALAALRAFLPPPW